MSRFSRFITLLGIVILAVLSLSLALAAIVPWKPFVAARLQTMIEAKGFKNVKLTLEDIGLTGAVLKDISVGAETPLTLQDLSVGYSLGDLWSGNLRNLDIVGLTVEARQMHEGWSVTGIESEGTSEEKAFALPVANEQIAMIPLESAKLTQSRLRVVGEAWSAEVPLEFTWQKFPAPKITYSGKDLALKAQGITMTASEAKLDAALDPAPVPDAKRPQWRGGWQMSNIAVQGIDVPIASLDGAGTVTAETERVALIGKFKSKDNQWLADFSVDLAFDKPEQSQLKITRAVMPWNAGTLSVQNIVMPLGAKRDVTIDLLAQHIALNALMQQLTGDKATAKGVVSGNLPVTLKADGTIMIGAGKLQADAPGTIAIAPEAIPGDNPQVALLRDLLKDLHYSQISIGVTSRDDRKLAVTLTIEGNNPAVQNGRPVKLNVQLSGDVLDFVQQSLMTFSDPRTFLQQGSHEKK